jgi:hypothetical protein
MTAIEQFNPLEWLRQFAPGGKALNLETLKPILFFTLMWNLFETDCCDRHANPETIRRNVEKADENGLLRAVDFADFLAFFRARYVDNGDIEDLPNILLSSPGQTRLEREHVGTLQAVLKGDLRDINKVVFSLLFVAYRIRNNLFHGEKDVFTLDTQLELFKAVNALLGRYIPIGRSARPA